MFPVRLWHIGNVAYWHYMHESGNITQLIIENIIGTFLGF